MGSSAAVSAAGGLSARLRWLQPLLSPGLAHLRAQPPLLARVFPALSPFCESVFLSLFFFLSGLNSCVLLYASYIMARSPLWLIRSASVLVGIGSFMAFLSRLHLNFYALSPSELPNRPRPPSI